MDLFKKKKNKKKQSTNNDQREKANKKEPFSATLQQNRKTFEKIFQYPANDALKVRELEIPSVQRKALVLFITGAADTMRINQFIIEPLLQTSSQTYSDEIVEVIMNNVL